MTLYQFNELNIMEQAVAVCNGVYIARRQDDNHHILLYSLDNFYVEVFHDKKHNLILRFKSFSSVRRLEPYLPGIDITAIMNC